MRPEAPGTLMLFAVQAVLGERATILPALDLMCGNGWYLRRLAARMPGLRGIGVDGFDVNIRQATAEREGLGDRLRFLPGEIHGELPPERVDLVAMSRAPHHVWESRENVFPRPREALNPAASP